jgi:BCD family chlorophyll transporter-like MFS transporter
MNLAPKDQAGMALGTWGAVQATAAGTAMAFGGVLRDSVASWADSATGYHTVYGLELALLCITIIGMLPLIRSKSNSKSDYLLPVSIEK